MSEQTPTIVVAGDVTVDWLQWPASCLDEGLNWQLYDGVHWAAQPGGALLLADMLRRAGRVDVRAPKLDDLANASTGQVLHSLAELKRLPALAGDRKQGQVFRIAQFRGYAGPQQGQLQPLPIQEDDAEADLVVLDDAGNGFREAEAFWPASLLDKTASPLVLYKMSRPLLQGALWQRIRQTEPERLIIVINADHLREMGVNISRRLSWERTAKDFVWQMACNPILTQLANTRNLVVRFGLEGAIHYSSSSQGVRSCLYFDPAQIEGSYADCYPGHMQGFSDAFVAALAWTLVHPPQAEEGKEPVDPVEAGILAGLRASRRLLRLGYGPGPDLADFPSPTLLHQDFDQQTEFLAQTVVPNPTVPEPPDPDFWSILKDRQGMMLDDLAHDLVVEGTTEALQGVPVGKFGYLRTADRAEIEGLRSIRNLIDQYLSCPAQRPLSIAVFGAPGSGKSFAVTQVAGSISGEHPVKKLEFNLSQFRSLDDLAKAFHIVRDTALEGSIPLVFFDEFDAGFDGELGWLKYFLAPMQDGVFREGEINHPLGRAIFVFAGGTHSSFQEFAGLAQKNSREIKAEQQAAHRRFQDVKGPDFVSRLRGFVNILGPNPVNEEDATYLIRRAMLLRSLVERKAPQVLDSQGRVRIDKGLLRALLRVPAYHHGARSMEAILDMSMLAGKSRWEQAALPPAEQLALHVDAPLFVRLMLRDILLTGAREVLGRAVHEFYRRRQEGKRPSDDPAMQPWEALSEDLRESNRQQADHIPVKLRAIKCGYRPMAGSQPAAIDFSAGEIETMARLEHERWVVERRLAGWTHDPERNPERKTSPYLAPYDELPEDVKELDRQAVRTIPDILALAKFEVYRR